MDIPFVRRALIARLLAASGTLAGGCTMAWAQDAALPTLAPAPTPTVEQGGVELDVSRRHRKEFDAAGIAIGSWTLLPSVSGHVGYESNIYGSEGDRKSDGFGEVQPSLILQSGFTGGSLNLQADGRFRRFFSQSAADETSYGGSADGTYDLSGTASLLAGGSVKQLIERRDSSGFPNGLVEPIRYLESQAYLRGQYAAGELRGLASFDYARFDFRDIRTINPDGTTTRQDQKIRDQQIYRGSLSLQYDLTAFFGVYAQGVVSSIRYREAEIAPGVPNLSAMDYKALVGVSLGGGQLIQGSIGVGYNWRDYQAGSLGTIGGFALNADVKYFVTPLLTLTATASRSIEQATIENTGANQQVIENAHGFISTGGSVRADYELLRQFILNASLSYRDDNFRRDPRHDKVFEADAGATYHLNRRVSLEADASYLKRRVKGDPLAASYDDVTVSIGFRFGL